MALLKHLPLSDIAPYIRDEKFLKEHDIKEAISRAFEVSAEGFPSRDADRKNSGETSWWISDAAFLLQKTLPIWLHEDEELKSDEIELGYGDESDGRIWLFDGRVYYTADKELTAEDVRALLNVDKNKRRLVLEKAHALQAISDNFETPKRRESIPQVVRVDVWQRDGGRCVECESQEKLEFDHIIPFSMGGSNTTRNLQLLCETCNRRKGASLG
jgi:hypothetical protein